MTLEKKIQTKEHTTKFYPASSSPIVLFIEQYSNHLPCTATWT